MTIQFGSADERDFLVALNSSGGRERIDSALMKIDVEHAHASVETDREFILAIVQREMGLGTFNELIRNGIKREYSNVNKSSAFCLSPSMQRRTVSNECR